MKRLCLYVCSFISAVSLAVAPLQAGTLVLFDKGTVVGHIIVPDKPSAIETLAAQKINRATQEIFGFTLPVLPASQAHGVRSAIVLGTPETNPMLRRLEPNQSPDGFLITALSPDSVAIVSRTSGGVLNGATYLADFALQAHGTGAALSTETVRRDVPLRIRGIYALTCWGLAPRYRRQDWEKIIDGMADDGMNVVYFWLSGIFRSKAFPESFIYPETPLTTDDIRQLIEYAHTRGIQFYLGTGVFGWFGIDEIAKYHANMRDVGMPYMSRTLPAARAAMKAYLLELYNTFPKADGMWLEIADEGDYHCIEPECLKPLDAFGSTESGESEVSFLKDFSTTLWRKFPDAKLVWGIGYPEAHKWDVKYYDALRLDFKDPRYYFMEVRDNWALPDSGGVLKPLRDISPNVIHWDEAYRFPLRDIGERAHRIQEDGLAGYVMAFQPGFGSNSVFGRTVPFPINAIPYRLTRFAYREFTLDPNLSWNDFRTKLVDYFFGEGADPQLADLTLTLFDFMRTGPIKGSFRELTDPVDGHDYGQRLKPRLDEIEMRLSRLEPDLGPRARAIGLPLLRQAIHDLRVGYSIQ